MQTRGEKRQYRFFSASNASSRLRTIKGAPIFSFHQACFTILQNSKHAFFSELALKPPRIFPVPQACADDEIIKGTVPPSLYLFVNRLVLSHGPTTRFQGMFLQELSDLGWWCVAKDEGFHNP